VRGLEWTDLSGGSGRYTGEVDNDQLPHGSGIMKYDFGLIAEGDWVHGVLREGPLDRMISAAAMNGGGQSVMSGRSIGVSGHSVISSPAISIGPGMSVGPGMSIGSNYMYQQGPGFPMAPMHMMPMHNPAGSVQMGRGPQAMGHQMMPMHMPQMQMPPQFMHPMQMQMMPQHMQMNMQTHPQMQQHSQKPPVAEIKIAKNR